MPRIVCRFSCGVTSFVATYLAILEYGKTDLLITYSDPGNEHPDNKRFLTDCERWFDHPIQVLRSEEYKNAWDLWDRSQFLVSRHGAECTGVMKRAPTYEDTRIDDILVLGMDAGEKNRADRFRVANPEIQIRFPLIENGMSKSDCFEILKATGIEIPAMYRLGYRNNNCIGCVKGGMGYWNKIRKDFPDVYERMATLQRKLGPGSYFWRERDTGERISLDALAPDRGKYESEPSWDCGVVCSADT